MRLLLTALCLSALAGGAGCNVGRLMKPSEFDFLHPAVQWAYRPGDQVFISTLLFLPMEAQNNIVAVEVRQDCVIVTEEAMSSPGGLVLWRQKEPTYRCLSLKDGTRLTLCAETGGERVRLERRPFGPINVGDPPSGVFAAVESYATTGKGVHASGTSIVVGKHEGKLIEVARYKYTLSVAKYLWAPGNKLLVVFPEMVICIDVAMAIRKE